MSVGSFQQRGKTLIPLSLNENECFNFINNISNLTTYFLKEHASPAYFYLSLHFNGLIPSLLVVMNNTLNLNPNPKTGK